MAEAIPSIEAIAREVASYARTLPPETAGFLTRVYSSGIDVYRRRLEKIGFAGMARVLDAGCGFGQWSLALASMGSQVCAIDNSEVRTRFLRQTANHLGIDGVEVRAARLTDTGCLDSEFDAVFCYGVIFLTPWKESLAELARVLKPGGRIYVNANGMGWYKHLWYTAHNQGEGYDPQALVPRVLANTLNYRRGKTVEDGIDILIEPEELRDELEALGFTSVEVGGEGTLGVPVDGVTPFFRGDYLGDTGVYEVLATKR